MKKSFIEFYARLAHAIAVQFGPKCEVVVHDLCSSATEHTIIAIENGHISGRSIGDGPSHIVLETLQHANRHTEDKLGYLIKTKDGKILKSSTIFIRDDRGRIIGILGINFDISLLLAMENDLRTFTGSTPENTESSETISLSVGELLDELIEQGLRRVGKPVELMNKEDKVEFIKSLNDAGAFLITKSGPKVCQFLDISKYTLYSYLDEIKSREE